MTAPDKIWANRDHWTDHEPKVRAWEYNEYTRSDLIPAMLAEARAEALRETITGAMEVVELLAPMLDDEPSLEQQKEGREALAKWIAKCG